MASKCNRGRSRSRTPLLLVQSPPTREPNRRRRRVASLHRDAVSAVPLGTQQGLADMTAETNRTPPARRAGGARGVRGGGQPSRDRGVPGGRPPGPARPTQPAQRLLTAAEELFGERSYHRTTVADICARAGMATGSFYSY